MGHTACMVKRRHVYKVSVGNLRERDLFEDKGVEESIILR
jgi:hypothetical protein